VSRILEIATRVSKPISLAGLIVGIFFLIVRLIVSYGLIPQVSAVAGGVILLRIINGFIVLSVLAVVLGFVAYVIRVQNPKLHPTYVSVVTDTPWTLAQIVNAVRQGQNVTINFNANCGPSVRTAKIEPGKHEGSDIKRFLENLKQRVAGESIDYSVKQEGDRRYEIVCK